MSQKVSCVSFKFFKKFYKKQNMFEISPMRDTIFKNIYSNMSKILSQDVQTELRRKRFRQAKKFLRPLPRRSNLHKYPILKWFASSARRRDYLWSLHPKEMIRAIWIGWIISLIPMYGLQMAVAFVACFIFRANALFAMALQWITNPLTIPPILISQYFFGNRILKIFFDIETIGLKTFEVFRENEFWTGLKTLASDVNRFDLIFSTLFGGGVLSIIGASVSVLVYKFYKSRHALKLYTDK